MQYWFQKPDFSVVEGELLTADECIKAFNAVNWQEEIEAQGKLEASGEENCDPTFGLKNSAGRMLSLCNVEENSYYHYDYQDGHTGFWIFKQPKNKCISRMEISQNELTVAISKFYENDYDWFLQDFAEGTVHRSG